jgi:L-asparaginase
MQIRIYTVGGTIDKVYFDQKSAFEVGEPKVGDILAEANVTLDYTIEAVLHKDSLEMTGADRQLIVEKASADPCPLIVLTHGTDTMIETALALEQVAGKVIVLTGAMQPARFRSSDATFNIAAALTAVQLLPAGVYIAMNGRIFKPGRIRKNRRLNRFEQIDANSDQPAKDYR